MMIKIEKKENFFKEIDSEIKAYLLGFIAADGNISKEGRISVAVKIQDEYITKLLQENISPKNKLVYSHNKEGAINRQPQVCWKINSVKMKKDLENYNLLPNKTLNGFNMNNIPEEYKIHYIRGYFDGDGSIYRGFSQGRNKICVNFTNSTKDILIDIQRYFNNLIKFKLETKISVKGNIYYVLAIYNKIESKLFYEQIYKNANYFFKRKFEKFNFDNTVLNSEIKESESV